MKKLSLVCSVFAILLTSCSTDSVRKTALHKKIDYIIEPATHEGTPSLKVTVSFLSDTAKQTTLVLPERWASENDYYKDIRDLKVLTPNAELKDGSAPHLRIINAPPNTPLKVSYIVIPGKAHGMNPFRALITQTYFHIFGYELFATPKMPWDQPIDLTIQWQNFPAKYSFANSFGVKKSHQELTLKFETFRHAVYVGGDFRIKEERIDDAPVFIALRGKWLFSDKDYATRVRKVIETERAFWNDHGFPFFLITLIPNGEKCCSTGGTGLTDSFATFVAEDQKLDSGLSWLYAHELFHTWNGQKIGRAEPEPLVYWFSEGFTNYYARLLSLRAGLMSLNDYVDDYNEAIYNYYFSSAKTEPNSRVQKDFWNNHDVEKLPYYRGDLMAHHWNLTLKKELGLSASIDAPMRDLLKEAQTKSTVISNETWNRLMSHYLKAGIRDDLTRYIDAGEAITPEPDALGTCVKQEWREIGKFEYGFDREATYANMRIKGLKADSAAYAAGLREGQKILIRKVASPPFSESRFKIKDEKGVRWIKFFAMGTERRRIPFYVIDKAQLNRTPDACLAWFN